MWTDYFLKFDNEAAWLAAIPAEWQGDEGLITAGDNHAIDVIGVMYRDDTPEGEQPVAREGFHVNLRLTGPLSDDLTAYVVTPEKPARMFA